MPSAAEVETLNQELATQINQDALADPRSPFAGRLVGIANGTVVVVADSFKEVIARLRAAQPDPRKIFALTAGVDWSKPVLVGPELQSQTRRIQIDLAYLGGHKVRRSLLAATEEGCADCVFDLLLTKTDCLHAAGVRTQSVTLNGAYVGVFPVYLIRVVVGELGFDEVVSAVAVPETPPGVDGIASPRFLARFLSGQFGTSEDVERVLFGGPVLTCVADIEARNRELSRRIYREARADPRSPYAGKLVGIANGEIVVICGDLGTVSSQLRKIEPDTRKTCIADTTVDFSKPQCV